MGIIKKTTVRQNYGAIRQELKRTFVAAEYIYFFENVGMVPERQCIYKSRSETKDKKRITWHSLNKSEHYKRIIRCCKTQMVQ